MIATLSNRERVREETFKWVWPRPPVRATLDALLGEGG